MSLALRDIVEAHRTIKGTEVRFGSIAAILFRRSCPDWPPADEHGFRGLPGLAADAGRAPLTQLI